MHGAKSGRELPSARLGGCRVTPSPHGPRFPASRRRAMGGGLHAPASHAVLMSELTPELARQVTAPIRAATHSTTSALPAPDRTTEHVPSPAHSGTARGQTADRQRRCGYRGSPWAADATLFSCLVRITGSSPAGARDSPWDRGKFWDVLELAVPCELCARSDTDTISGSKLHYTAEHVPS
ncbi:hypothetical protein CALCODRAFT_56179 [Calocera cornea HHB12733]|uniref:Uncharacterized protein n=1 Tax=Calocera cornea HHB12733 TaxID=1353952 RepID=A0A165DPG1_9BASI|nr:hypothetical protein CALCODRAFT_56179 [Calocera cornea HHB12733]